MNAEKKQGLHAASFKKWIGQITSELETNALLPNGDFDINAAYRLPSLQSIADALDIHGHWSGNDGAFFTHKIPNFGHVVHIPIKNEGSILQKHTIHDRIVRQCFHILFQHCKLKKRRRHDLVKALLHWNQKSTRQVWIHFCTVGWVLGIRDSLLTLSYPKDVFFDLERICGAPEHAIGQVNFHDVEELCSQDDTVCLRDQFSTLSFFLVSNFGLAKSNVQV